jgi:S-adenosylmethionine:tRNA ribosyltransferase-isomerase
MHLSDFDYELPAELIAQEPIRPRDAARMMVVDSRTSKYMDSLFRNLTNFLHPSDVLVLNDTRVLQARFYGKLERKSGGTRDIEVLFAAPVQPQVSGAANAARGETWEVMCRPGKRIRSGDRVTLAGAVEGTFGTNTEYGLRLLHLKLPDGVDNVLDKYGRVPLPPYIERLDTALDAENYQTVFARKPGAIAAPTAGLHFTEGTFRSLREFGVAVETITLHVGVGTFIPIRTENPAEHHLKAERFQITEATASRLNLARAARRRIVAVGTTTARTLEYVYAKYGRFEPGCGETDLFILPGYQFCAVDALLTNFHLPRSTLLMLVSAFAPRSLILDAYRHAREQRYRFYSYGDCMLIV